MTGVLGLRAEKRDMAIWFHSDEGEPRFAVSNVVNADRDRAVAAVYWTSPPQHIKWDGVRVDDQGTEVWPWMVGAPGYWCWLLDLAVETGFEW